MTLEEAKEKYNLSRKQEKDWQKHFNRALKGFNRMLKDKNIERIVKSENRYCIMYKNGQQFFVSGAVADAANICYEKI